MFGEWNSLAWLIITLLPLLLMKRWINQHVQGLGFLLFGNDTWSLALYFLLFLPGIVLHELSHWLAATLLGVKTGKISLGPSRRYSGQVRLGSIKVAKTDFFRESLIGLAPLVAGSAIILLIANLAFGVKAANPLLPASASLDQAIENLVAYARVPDAWLWLYLIFAVSNAMLPSESDRRPWLPLLICLGLVALLFYFMWGIPTIPDVVVAWASRGLEYVAFAFGLTVIVDAIFIVVIYLLEAVISGLKGQRVEY